MKVLWPTDFSKASLNALWWTVDFIKAQGGGSLDIVHCINIRSRAGMFLHLDDLFVENAKEDISRARVEISERTEDIELTDRIAIDHPKQYLPSYISRSDFDFVIQGTYGLSALKEMTVGSVTDVLFRKSHKPIIAIPESAVYKDIKKIVLSVDDKPYNAENLKGLVRMLDLTKAHLYIVHVSSQHSPEDFVLDSAVESIIQGRDHSINNLKSKGSILDIVDKFCIENNVDMLCMVHRKHSWISRILLKSTSTQELYHIRLPVLMLNEHQS